MGPQIRVGDALNRPEETRHNALNSGRQTRNKKGMPSVSGFTAKV